VYTFEDIISENEEFKAVKEYAKKAARTSSSILIHGESGTGKELFAQSMHNESFRKDKPFVAINCGAIPSELIESELFGYEPGAFTGASKGTKLGKLEVASGGSIFFDEIESMSLNVHSNCVVRRPTWEYRFSMVSSCCCFSLAVALVSLDDANTLSALPSNSFLQRWITPACTPYSEAISEIRRSSLSVSSTIYL
jgi:DNA polymerase III delta prime subunit